jgi:hypothetical protein
VGDLVDLVAESPEHWLQIRLRFTFTSVAPVNRVPVWPVASTVEVPPVVVVVMKAPAAVPPIFAPRQRSMIELRLPPVVAEAVGLVVAPAVRLVD